MTAATKWRPIETAPADGTAVLVYRPHAPTSRIIGVDCRHPNTFNGGWQNSRAYEQPTDWMPLPPLPAVDH
jgi:hypothetical protein